MKKRNIFIRKVTFALLTGFMLLMTTQLIAQKYSNDIIVKNTPTENQRNASLAVAGNGWLYAAFVSNTSTTSGYNVYKSTNNGQTWSIFYNSTPSTTYTCDEVKVIVCGAAPYKVFIGVSYHQNSSYNYFLYVATYDGTTATYINTPLSYAFTSTVYDFDMAADDLFPSYGSSPYSVGLLYSRNSSFDSVVFAVSTNGGTSFTPRKKVATTSQYFGKVSLAYGRCPAHLNGNYYAVWENKITGGASVGRIGYSRTDGTIYNIFNDPFYVGSTYGYRNPKIACQFNTTNNDSTDLTAVIVAENYFGNLDNDIVGFYNKKAAHDISFNNWTSFVVDWTTKNTKQPDITYDSYWNNFLVTYWDSTNTYLPYVLKGFNMLEPNTWTTYYANYYSTPVMGSLLQPYPVVQINNALHQVAFLWTKEGTAGNGVILFDAEYSTVGINEMITYKADKINNIYPSPAYGATNIVVELNKSALVEINAYDMAGKKISNLYNAQTSKGINTISIDVSNLANGNYVIELLTPESRTTKKIMVAHQ